RSHSGPEGVPVASAVDVGGASASAQRPTPIAMSACSRSAVPSSPVTIPWSQRNTVPESPVRDGEGAAGGGALQSASALSCEREKVPTTAQASWPLSRYPAGKSLPSLAALMATPETFFETSSPTVLNRSVATFSKRAESATFVHVAREFPA